MSLEPGQVVDQFRLDEVIHDGPVALVYAATDLMVGRKVAFKVLADRYATDTSARQRFVTEAQIAAALDGHPHIVTVYKWGQFEDSMYFVTELIDGITLAELLVREPDGQPLPPYEALSWFDQIASAVDFAHKRGVIHRYLEPANIMITMTENSRDAYVLDFGITKTGDADDGDQPDSSVGTGEYSPPEQAAGAQALDRRADVYSLAACAFHALAGRPRRSVPLHGAVPSARAIRPELPQAVDAVFAKALATNRDSRHASCSEFVRDLRRAFPAAPAEFRRAVPAMADGGPVSLGGEEPSRRKWPLVGVGAVVAVGAAILAFFVVTDSKRSPATGSIASDATTSPASTITTTSTTGTTTTTTTTTSTTLPATTTTILNPLGFLPGQPVTDPGDDPGAAYAVGIQNRHLPESLAPVGSRARLYAEWLWALGPTDRGPVIAGERGFIVQGLTDVEILDVVVEAGVITDFAECRQASGGQRCGRLSEIGLETDECEPSDGCPTLLSASGQLRAYLRATNRMHWPEQTLMYEIVASPQPVRAISEPTGRLRYQPGSPYLMTFYEGQPGERTVQTLTVTYEDGSLDEVTIVFNVPLPASASTTAA